MRIADIPMIHEVREEYIDLRHNRFARSEAIREMLRRYDKRLATGTKNDRLFFWIGMADAQYFLRELTFHVAHWGIRSLFRLQYCTDKIAVGDYDRRKLHYSLAPMPERRVLIPKAVFQCQWEIGDTYAYRLKGFEAQEQGIEGKYMLLRKLDTYDFCDGRRFPVVTLSLWDGPELPKSAAEYLTAEPIRVRGEKGVNPEYRVQLLIKNRHQLDMLELEYVGNFPVPFAPTGEVIIKNPNEIAMLLPAIMDKKCTLFWRHHTGNPVNIPFMF